MAAAVVWSAAATYLPGNIVSEGAVRYKALRRSSNKLPSISPGDWLGLGDATDIPKNVSDGLPGSLGVGVQQQIPGAGESTLGGQQQIHGVQPDLAIEPIHELLGTGDAVKRMQGRYWDSGATYSTGNVVDYTGATWLAKRVVQGEVPGQTDAWKPVSVTGWYPVLEYERWDVVLVAGQRYVAQLKNVGVNPLTGTPGVWILEGVGSAQSDRVVGQVATQQSQQIATQQTATQQTATQQTATQQTATQQTQNSGSQQWDPAKQYFSGNVVLHEGISWRAISISSGAAPGETSDWKPVAVSKWYAGVIYQKGDVVLVGGLRFMAQREAKGVDPLVDDTGVWVKVDENNNQLSTDKSSQSGWVSTKIYLAGDEVTWGGVVWQAQYWVEGGQPGQDQAWKPTTLTIWYAGVAYLKDSQSIFGGETWKALWWTRGEQPGTTEVWKPLGVTAWYASIAYVAGDIVIYEGSRWQAKWWTKGEPPGLASSWMAI